MPCICPASALPAADGPAPFVGAFAYSAASFGGSGSVDVGAAVRAVTLAHAVSGDCALDAADGMACGRERTEPFSAPSARGARAWMHELRCS